MQLYGEPLKRLCLQAPKLSIHCSLSLRIFLVEKCHPRFLVPWMPQFNHQFLWLHPVNLFFVIQNLLISKVLFPNIIVSHVNFANLLVGGEKKGGSLFKITFLLILNEIDFFPFVGHFYFFLLIFLLKCPFLVVD